MNEEPSVLQWACLCCMLVMANAECCDSDDHGGDSIEPLSEIPRGAHTSLGGFNHDHGSDCEVFKTGNFPADHECDCLTIPFSNNRCDGCGSWLAGERHAFVVWYPKAPGKCLECGDTCHFLRQTESGINWYECITCRKAFSHQELSPLSNV